jgi:hypothetical protein
MSWVLTGFGTEQRAVIGYADFWIMPRGRDSGRFLLALDDGRSGVLFGLNTVDGIFIHRRRAVIFGDRADCRLPTLRRAMRVDPIVRSGMNEARPAPIKP